MFLFFFPLPLLLLLLLFPCEVVVTELAMLTSRTLLSLTLLVLLVLLTMLGGGTDHWLQEQAGQLVGGGGAALTVGVPVEPTCTAEGETKEV